jgi:hypothetical protein
MDRALAAREYASHLTDADLSLLAAVDPDQADAAALRGDPVALLRRLEHPGAFQAVLGPDDRRRAVSASPFLVFALLVQRAVAELASVDHVPERTGLRQRVPLFDAPALREFLAEEARRLFLAELLASFTRVASGRYRVRPAAGRGPGGSASSTRCGWRACSTRCPTPNGPASTAGSATCRCS